MENYINITENYSISNTGNVKGFNGRLLSQKTKSNGYKEVCIYLNKKPKMKYVHRLVAEFFISNIESGFIVNHIDGNKQNNNVENLEIVTYSENSLHSFNVLGNKPPSFKGESHPMTKLSESDVLNIRNMYGKGVKTVDIYNMYKDKVSLSSLRKICYKTTWKHI